jgi:hypothetical protein
MIGHRVVLRPRSFFEIADLAIVFLRDNASSYAKLLPWLLLPAVTAASLHTWGGTPAGLLLPLEICALQLLSPVYTRLCGSLMVESTVSLRQVQVETLRALPRWLISCVLGWLAVSFLFFYPSFVFAPEGIVLEHGKVFASFRRSRALSGVAPGRAAAFAVTVMLATVGGMFAAELLAISLRELVGLQINAADYLQHASWPSFLGIALVHPYLATFRFLLYIDCRTRREGWDLQREFAALTAAGSSGTGVPEEQAA